MIDTAIPDVVSDGLINFDKRRKEFEVLAQVSQKGKKDPEGYMVKGEGEREGKGVRWALE